MSHHHNTLNVHDYHLGKIKTGAKGDIISLIDPQIENIHFEDIASALSNVCRFGGHIKPHYSVAQHSIVVCIMAPVQLKRAALMHDAAEAYLGDVVKPLKVLLGETYRELEERMTAAIFKKFDIDIALMEQVKPFDLKALEIEEDYREGGCRLQDVIAGCYGLNFPCIWPPHYTNAMFINAWTKINKQA